MLENDPELWEKYCVQRGTKKTFRFWQPGGGYDRNLWGAKAIHYSIHYIEANPVRKELVKTAEEWIWSSAYARHNSVGLIPDDCDVPILII